MKVVGLPLLPSGRSREGRSYSAGFVLRAVRLPERERDNRIDYTFRTTIVPLSVGRRDECLRIATTVAFATLMGAMQKDRLRAPRASSRIHALLFERRRAGGAPVEVLPMDAIADVRRSPTFSSLGM